MASPVRKPYIRAHQFAAYQDRIKVMDVQSRQANDAFQNIVAKLGAFTPNILEGTQYPLTRFTRNYILLTSLYRTHWIIRKVVDARPEDMLKNWLDLTGSMSPEQIKEFQTVVDDTGTQAQLLTTMKWGNLYGGAGALIVIEGDEDNLDEPLSWEEVEPDTYRGLIPFDRWSGITPNSKVSTDLRYPMDYGLPESYHVTTETGEGYDIHHSRILRFIGGELPNWERQAEMRWGISVIETMMEELQKRDNTSWNMASLVFRANLIAIKQQSLDQMLSGLGSSQAVQQKWFTTMQAISQMISNQGLLVLPEKGGMETHPYSFAGLPEVYMHFKEDISAASDYPYSRLFGRPSGGMGTTNEGDEDTYYNNAEAKRQMQVEPQMKKLMPIISMSTWGKRPKDFGWKWRPIRILTNEERTELGTKMTTAVTEPYNAGAFGRQTYLKELKQQSELTGLFTNITDEMIEEADDEPITMGEDLLGGAGGFTGEPREAKGNIGKPKGQTKALPAPKESKEEPGKAGKKAAANVGKNKKGKDSNIVASRRFQGLKIDIEQEAGDVRKGDWGEITMTAPYGYIQQSEGVDGDHVDCFLGPDPWATKAYIVHTKNPESGEYDEDKVMLGFSTPELAKSKFLENYSNPAFFGSIDTVPMPLFYSKLDQLRGEPIEEGQEPLTPEEFTGAEIAGQPLTENISKQAACHAIALRPTYRNRPVLEMSSSGSEPVDKQAAIHERAKRSRFDNRTTLDEVTHSGVRTRLLGEGE